MFLEMWMVIVMIIIFGIALHHLYRSGYNDGYQRGHVEGGVFTYKWIMDSIKQSLGRDVHDKLATSIIQKSIADTEQ